MGALESGRDFLAGVLAKLPEEQRAQAKAIFDAAEAQAAVTTLGDGTLARSDYSRNMDTLREKEAALNEHYERLNSWYDVNKSALEEAKTLKAGGGGNGNGNGKNDPPADPLHREVQSPGASALSEAEIRRIAAETVDAQARDLVAISSFISTTAGRHQQIFGEPLDAMELQANPKLGRPIVGQPGRVFSLQDAYTEKYGERLAAKHKEAEDKRIDAEVEKRLADRTRANTSQPFPLRHESSPLDVLSTKEGSAAHTLDSAVAEYERLVAAKST